MAPYSSTLPWKIPWVEEPGGLQSMGSLRVGHDWVTSLSFFTFMHRRRKWQPTPVFLPGESQGRGAWWAAVYGVAQSRTRQKWLSSSSSSRPWWNLAIITATTATSTTILVIITIYLSLILALTMCLALLYTNFSFHQSTAENHDTETLSDLPKDRQITSYRARIQIQICLCQIWDHLWKN